MIGPLKQTESPRKILIFRALQLGDLLCTVPAFRAIRKSFPHARISLVGLPWAAEFVQRFSMYLDEWIEFPGWPGLPERAPQIEQIPGFLKNLQEQKFDLAIQMQGAGTITNPLISLFGARRSAGFFLPDAYQPDNELFFPYPSGLHEIHTFLHLIEMLGIPPAGDHTEFPALPEDETEFAHLVAEKHLEPGGYACLHPGARYLGRRWPAEKFAVVGDALAERGLRIIVTGAESERELTSAVVRQMRAPAVDAAGQTSLGALALLLANARLLVSNDTGVSHIAAAVRAPSVVLFSASDPNRWKPLNSRLHRVILRADQAQPEAVIAEVDVLEKEKRQHAGTAR